MIKQHSDDRLNCMLYNHTDDKQRAFKEWITAQDCLDFALEKKRRVEQQHYLGPADRDTEEPPSG